MTEVTTETVDQSLEKELSDLRKLVQDLNQEVESLRTRNAELEQIKQTLCQEEG